MDSKEREDIDTKLWEIYNKLEDNDVPSGYKWPNFVESSGDPAAGSVLSALHVALRALVWCERNARGKNSTCHETDEKFAIPFSVLYSMYSEHFKRYVSDQEVPDVSDVTGAFIKEVNKSEFHEAPKEIQ
jgi:hypothetical protein